MRTSNPQAHPRMDGAERHPESRSGLPDRDGVLRSTAGDPRPSGWTQVTRRDMRWNSRSGNASATVCSVEPLRDRARGDQELTDALMKSHRPDHARGVPRDDDHVRCGSDPRLLAHRRRLLRTRHRHHRAHRRHPDPATAEACIIWEYWNADLVDETKPGNGCPEFSYRAFPWLEDPRPTRLRDDGPRRPVRLLYGNAQRMMSSRGKAIEKYLPYAASYTAAMSAANATLNASSVPLR